MRRLAAFGLGLVLISAGLSSCIGGNPKIEFDAIFRDVGNLAPLAQVQAADVRIGTVTGIHLDGYTARVSMSIRSDVDLPENALAYVRSTSLLGEQLVELKKPVSEQPSTTRLHSGITIPLSRTGKAPTLDEAFIKLGAILQGGNIGDLAAFINSSAEIVRGKEEELGQLFGELRKTTATLANRAPEIGSAIDSFDSAFATLAQGSATLKSSVSSSADASAILANQQGDLDRLVDSLDRFSAVAARYTKATTPDSDRALKDLRLILNEVMKTTDDLDKSLSALARFTDLWPRVIPGDYVQLDVVAVSPPGNTAPSAATTGVSSPQSKRGPKTSNTRELLTRAIQ